MPPYIPSETEARLYYVGLPSHPILVARSSSNQWNMPTHLEAYVVKKELRPVGKHMVTEVWEDNLAPKIHKILKMMKVKWTSTDVVRIREEDKSFAPIILWIGIIPKSLSANDGILMASACKKILQEYNITDMEVEIRESVVIHSAGPKLLRPTSNSILSISNNPTIEVFEPLTPTLGLPISTCWAEGTGGFFISEDKETKRLLLVTARHVVFPPDKCKNELYKHKNESQPHHNVILFSDIAFQKYLQTAISGTEILIKHLEGRVKDLEEMNSPEALRNAQAQSDRLLKAIEMDKILHQDISTHWATPESRVLGHVVLSPPINHGVGSEGYTEDWAIIEIDPSKIDKSNFNGNAIDLGTRLSLEKYISIMSTKTLSGSSFDYPIDRLLKLQGTIPDEEMYHPTALDHNGEPCLMVIKRGATTGLTIGRSNNIPSYICDYDSNINATGKTSKEWAILSQGLGYGAFSARGDSGSVIVDGHGRIGGLLTGGTGAPPSSNSDITYATPITFLLKCMTENGLSTNINPVLPSQQP